MNNVHAKKKKKKRKQEAFPVGLRIWHCHCCGSGSILAQELRHAKGMAKNNNNKKKGSRRSVNVLLLRKKM